MASSPSKETLKRVRKLEEIADELRQGEDFPVTRLTTIKSLCGEPQAAAAFALFLAQRIQCKIGFFTIADSVPSTSLRVPGSGGFPEDHALRLLPRR